MKKNKAKRIIDRLNLLDIVSCSVSELFVEGIDKYFEEMEFRRLKNKKLDDKLEKLKIQSEKLNLKITKDTIDSYLNDLLLRS